MMQHLHHYCNLDFPIQVYTLLPFIIRTRLYSHLRFNLHFPRILGDRFSYNSDPVLLGP